MNKINVDDHWPPTPTDESIKLQVLEDVWQASQEYLMRRAGGTSARKSLAKCTQENMSLFILSWSEDKVGTSPEEIFTFDDNMPYEALEAAEDISGVGFNVRMYVSRTLEQGRTDVFLRDKKDGFQIADAATAEIINSLPHDVRISLAHILCQEHIIHEEDLYDMYRLETDDIYSEDDPSQQENEWLNELPEEDDIQYLEDESDSPSIEELHGEGGIGLYDEDDEPEWQARYEYALLRRFFGDIVQGNLVASDKPR